MRNARKLGGTATLEKVAMHDGTVVACKICDAPDLLRNEYRILNHLVKQGSCDFVPKPYALATFENPSYDARLNGKPCLVMEWIEGANLLDKASSAPMSAHDARKLARQLFLLGSEVQALGIVLRDPHPANVMVRPSGRIAFVDLGNACFAGSTDTHPMRWFKNGFEPPEARGAGSFGFYSDVYTLAQDVAYAMYGRKVDNPSALPSDAFSTWLARCIQPDPRLRFPTCKAALCALEQTKDTSATLPGWTTSVEQSGWRKVSAFSPGTVEILDRKLSA